MKKLAKLAMLVGGIAFAAKLVAAKKSEWPGLTESEVREKLDSRLPDRVSDEKRAAVADKVVSKMRERGVLREEEETSSHSDGGGVEEGSDSGDAEADGDSVHSTESG